MSTENGDKSPLSADERHRAILDRVQAQGTVTVRELAQTLGVAAVTVRVDVRELARRGLLNRVHGGATRIASPGTGLSHLAAPAGATGSGPAAAGEPGRAYTFGVVVPHASYYYPKVVSGAREAADARGARLILGVSQNDVAEERALVARLLDSGVDGLVIASRYDPQHSPDTQAWLRGLPVPVVLAERRAGWESGSVEHVATDHERGAFDAVQHLAGLGHQKIGLLHFATITAPRLRTGYEAALEALSLSVPPPEVPQDLLTESPQELEAKADAIAEAVRQGSLDALIVHHDVAALPLVSRLRQAGISVPGDLAVMAYDDELAALSDPPLTAVAPPREAVGATAVTLLTQRLNDPTRPLHHLLLRPELRVRASCGTVTETSAPQTDEQVSA
ncbi:substrate-binding domain-containing protein [Luteipulveratus mongoliensis]|uniref:DeoR faimly transcriptional regulator n=1 Tax=Luteipulveratus mongoliensis TaxID=571913 RepID=A0A0K1JKI4_9MICO|nr:substrate-binding domain-containing protein [Luteipulveratus mongoliensis]AKU17108.1 DeoR faimly transcriptional regulator [Luteipulveratus mongoliensis]